MENNICLQLSWNATTSFVNPPKALHTIDWVVTNSLPANTTCMLSRMLRLTLAHLKPDDCRLIQKLFWFLLLCIVDWITVIVFCIRYLAAVGCSLCWILQTVWFEVWSILITYIICLHWSALTRLHWLDSGYALDSWALRDLDSGFALNLGILVWPPKENSWIHQCLSSLICIGYPTRSMSYIVCMLMFKCIVGLAAAYLIAVCTTGSAVSGWSALRFTVRGILLCLASGWIGLLEPLPVAGPSCWNELPVESRDQSSPETFAKHLKTHLFRVVFFLMDDALLSLSFCRMRYQVQ